MHTLLQIRKTVKVKPKRKCLKKFDIIIHFDKNNTINKIHHMKMFLYRLYIRTPAATNRWDPFPTISADDKPRQNAAPTQKKNSIFIHGTLLNT